jgi:hypothetical protein
MTILIEMENLKPHRVYLSRVSFKEISALNNLNYFNTFLSSVCNYCDKHISNEIRNDYRTILLCGHHYHTECLCKGNEDHINIVRCIHCYEKFNHLNYLLKYFYSTYSPSTSTNLSNNPPSYINNNNNTSIEVSIKRDGYNNNNNYPILYKRIFY